MTRYRVARLINAEASRQGVEIVVGGDRITSVDAVEPTTGFDYPYAVPGFVDIHSHGGNGHDVMDGTMSALAAIAKHHLVHGTTTFLASTLTAPLDGLRAVLQTIRAYRDANNGEASQGRCAALAGVHLEGPWISAANLGAQNPRHVRAADPTSLSLIRENADLVRMVTFSYHNPQARELLRLLVELEIVAALGHDETTDVGAREAFASGASHLTHAFCSSSSFQRKDGFKHLGSLEMALMTPGVTVELIVDDRHITRTFWDFVRHNKSLEDIVAVSDSTRGAGLPENPGRTYDLGGVSFVVDQGVAWLPDRSVFAGSTCNLHRSFVLMVREWGVDPRDAVRFVSSNPARKLGFYPEIGRIEEGSRADLLLLDEDFGLAQVIKAGKPFPSPRRW
jgi:N-acetylglucosamine-6-phosphate deacetylase